MGLSIVIPTYKRWDRLAGKDYFRTARYVLPESQKKEYEKVLSKDRMIVIKDEDDGSVAKKRNWILKNIERLILMIDDDVKGLVMTEGMHKVEGKEHSKATGKIMLNWDQAERVIIEGFNLASQLECVLWGINVNTDERNYQQYKPFSLTQMVLGPFQGHLDHSLLFDERMGTKEDYDMSLQALNKYRKILRFNKFAYDCEHGINKGGIVAMRTMEKEMQDCRAIERKWSRWVIKYPLYPKNKTDLLNGNVHVPIAGV